MSHLDPSSPDTTPPRRLSTTRIDLGALLERVAELSVRVEHLEQTTHESRKEMQDLDSGLQKLRQSVMERIDRVEALLSTLGDSMQEQMHRLSDLEPVLQFVRKEETQRAVIAGRAKAQGIFITKMLYGMMALLAMIIGLLLSNAVGRIDHYPDLTYWMVVGPALVVVSVAYIYALVRTSQKSE